MAEGVVAPERLLLVCRLGGRRVGLPVGDVVEVQRPRPVAPVAGAPPYVRGAAVIRGGAVPVVDLAALLGVPDPEPPGRLVTVRSGPRVVALEVGAVEGTLARPGDDRAGVPPLLAAAPAAAMAELGTIDADLLAVLDGARLVAAAPEPGSGSGPPAVPGDR